MKKIFIILFALLILFFSLQTILGNSITPELLSERLSKGKLKVEISDSKFYLPFWLFLYDTKISYGEREYFMLEKTSIKTNIFGFFTSKRDFLSRANISLLSDKEKFIFQTDNSSVDSLKIYLKFSDMDLDSLQISENLSLDGEISFGGNFFVREKKIVSAIGEIEGSEISLNIDKDTKYVRSANISLDTAGVNFNLIRDSLSIDSSKIVSKIFSIDLSGNILLDNKDLLESSMDIAAFMKLNEGIFDYMFYGFFMKLYLNQLIKKPVQMSVKGKVKNPIFIQEKI